MFEAVFFDLDGSTLKDGRLAVGFASIAREHKTKTWIMTTGRSFVSVKRMGLDRGLDENAPQIFDNGALISSFNGNATNVVALEANHKERSLTFFEQAIRSGATFDYAFASVFPCAAYVWCPNGDLLQTFKDVNVCGTYSELVATVAGKDVLKLSVKSDDVFKAGIPDGVNAVAQQSCYDVVNPAVSKGNAIDKLRVDMNLSASQIAFICDDQNDISAIRHPNLRDMFVIQVGSKIAGERCDLRVDAPEKVGEAMALLLQAPGRVPAQQGQRTPAERGEAARAELEAKEAKKQERGGPRR